MQHWIFRIAHLKRDMLSSDCMLHDVETLLKTTMEKRKVPAMCIFYTKMEKFGMVIKSIMDSGGCIW